MCPWCCEIVAVDIASNPPNLRHLVWRRFCSNCRYVGISLSVILMRIERMPCVVIRLWRCAMLYALLSVDWMPSQWSVILVCAVKTVLLNACVSSLFYCCRSVEMRWYTMAVTGMPWRLLKVHAVELNSNCVDIWCHLLLIGLVPMLLLAANCTRRVALLCAVAAIPLNRGQLR